MKMVEGCCSGYEFDSKTYDEWIACCIRKHGPKGDKTMNRSQCVAAARKKFGRDSMIWISALEQFVTTGDSVEADQEGRPPKKWWDACIRTLEKGKTPYTEEQMRKICGDLWHKQKIRKMLPG